ncbi:MAG: GFA family protein [Pseudomonadota bacterium]
MSTTAKRSGRCLCGAVTFEIELKSQHFDACHCGMCRRWSGGPGLAVEAAAPPDIKGAENLATFKSSEWGVREFCKVCGSHLFWRAPELNFCSTFYGALDDVDGLTFEKQIYIDHKPESYNFAEKTETMTEAEVVAQFAGDGGGT